MYLVSSGLFFAKIQNCIKHLGLLHSEKLNQKRVAQLQSYLPFTLKNKQNGAT